jgi:hypothetical protein
MDLNEAIALLREALALRAPPHPDRSRSLDNLASAVQTRFQQHGGSRDLDEASPFIERHWLFMLYLIQIVGSHSTIWLVQ